MPNRGIAVQGTDGTERITNEGSITGDLFLGIGDDFFDNEAAATYIGTVFGEGGSDSVINRGAITGDVLLGAGIDSYEQEGAATRTGIVDGGTGTIDGGDGNHDLLMLNGERDEFEFSTVRSPPTSWRDFFRPNEIVRIESNDGDATRIDIRNVEYVQFEDALVRVEDLTDDQGYGWWQRWDFFDIA